MPDESCRRCGHKLYLLSKCTECRQPIQLFCKNCGRATLKQIHSKCTIGMEIICPVIRQELFHTMMMA